MEVAGQNGRPGDRPAAAINHAVERILMFMDRCGDKLPFRICKDERGFKGIEKRVLHARGEVERESKVVRIEELIERAGSGATQLVKTWSMEIELQEEGVVRSYVPEIVGQAVG